MLQYFQTSIENLPLSYLKENSTTSTGKVQSRDDRLQMIAQDLKEAVAERFWIQVKNHEYDKEISNILDQYKGPIPVIIRYEEEQKTIVSSQYFVTKSNELEEKLEELL